MRMLYVEDSDSERIIMKLMLEKLGYEPTIATNGKEALDLQRESGFQLILTDNSMPEMSGEEVCQEMRSHSAYGNPYVIMLTSDIGNESLIRCMDAGADDYLNKPCVSEELRVRLAAGCRIIRMWNAMSRQHNKLEDVMTRLRDKQRDTDRELALAEHLINQQMPKDMSLSADINVAVIYKMAQRIGGDTFGFDSLSPSRHFFYQLDVMGHGVASALLSFSLTNVIRQELSRMAFTSNQWSMLDELAKTLNTRFPCEQFADHYFTLFLGLIDEETSQLSFCLAGHPSPIIINSQGKAQPVPSGSFPIGLFDFADFTTHTLPLEPGAVILVSSDGLFDAISQNDTKHGQQMITDRVAKCQKRDAKKIRDEVRLLLEEQSHEEQEDDISMIVIKREEISPDLNRHFTINFDPNSLDLEKALNKIRLALEQNQVDDMIQMRLTASLCEMINNIIQHGDFPEGREKPPIKVEVIQKNPEIVVTINDETGPMPHVCPPKPIVVNHESGRGIHIVLEWTDSISYKRFKNSNFWALCFTPE